VKSVIAYKSIGILQIKDEAKNNRVFFIIFILFLFFSIVKSILRIKEIPFEFSVSNFILILTCILFCVFVFKYYRYDFSTNLPIEVLQQYDIEFSRFDRYGKIILHLNNGKKRIIIIDNGLQLEVFSKEIESLGIPQKTKNEKNSNR